MVFRSNFPFSKKAGDGFGADEGFQKTKEMVLGTNYLRKTKRKLNTKTMQKTPTVVPLLSIKIVCNS